MTTGVGMYGHRARIGLVIPSNNTVIEPELWAMRPPGVTVHGNRILSHGNTPEGIAEMEKSAARAAHELSRGEMSVIAYACLATSLVKGVEWTREVLRAISSDTGRPSITAAFATAEAVKAVGATRIAMATPYIDRIHALLPPFFAELGMEVIAARNLDVQNSLELWKIPPAEVCRFARAVDTPQAEALVIVATDLPSAPIIEELEQALGKPVITTNQAILWQCLALAGVPDPVEGYGRLLRQPR